MKYKRLAAIGLCSMLILPVVSCGQTQNTTDGTTNTSVTQSQSNQVSWKATYSNMNSKTSEEEVRKALASHLDKDSVEAFFNLVNDYNATVGSVGLTGDFSTFTKTDYDVEKISNFWTPKKGDFVGTNCRINSYCLLKNSIEIPKLEKDDSLLFVDNDAIDKGRVFGAEDKDGYANILILKDASILTKLSVIPDLLKGDVVVNENIEYIKARHIKISSDSELETDVDGDKSDDLPVEIKVLGQHIQVYSQPKE